MRELSAPAGRNIPLWPAPGTKPPLETAPEQAEYWTATGIAQPYAHGPHLNLFNVWTPKIEFFPAAPENNTGAAVIVAPGGCYQFLSWTMEGTEIAQWLNTIGVSAAVLKYRVPTRDGATPGTMELADMQRAISFVRFLAGWWGIDPNRVGCMGFSAGAHLCALAGNTTERSYASDGLIDEPSCHPAFTILMYPAYLAGDGALEPKIVPTKDTAPALFIHAADDPFTVESSLQYHAALRAAGVAAEAHIYASGGHGYGIRPTGYPCQTWPAAVAAWLKQGGWI
jgi:acetyl esterase/lipase